MRMKIYVPNFRGCVPCKILEPKNIFQFRDFATLSQSVFTMQQDTTSRKTVLQTTMSKLLKTAGKSGANAAATFSDCPQHDADTSIGIQAKS